MPKLSIVFDVNFDNGKQEKDFEKYNFEFVRNIEVDSKDLTPFYYGLRSFFRKNLTDEERDQLLQHIKNREMAKVIKRRKNISLEEAFGKDFFVEGVERIGTNRYRLLWGL